MAASAQRLDAIRLRMAPDRIHVLKFILEGYDGLAILSTVDRRLGLVELKYPAELGGDLRTLLRTLAAQVGLAGVPE